MNKFEERRQKMQASVAQWQNSGLSQKAFAEEQNIKLFTLRYWIQKQREAQKQDQPFLQLSPVSIPGMIIRYVNGTMLELPANIPLNVVRQLINL